MADKPNRRSPEASPDTTADSSHRPQSSSDDSTPASPSAPTDASIIDPTVFAEQPATPVDNIAAGDALDRTLSHASPHGPVDSTKPYAEGETGPVPFQESALAQFVERQHVGRWRYGDVFTAAHRHLRRRVRLLVMDAEYAADPELRNRFLASARAAATIHHPHIATQILEAGSAGDNVFVATETRPTFPFKLPPEPSQSWLHNHRQLGQAFLEAARGLAVIHAAGLAHESLSADSIQVDLATSRICLSGLGEPRPEGRSDDSEGQLSEAQKNDVRDLVAGVVESVVGEPIPADLTGRALQRWLRQQHPAFAGSMSKLAVQVLDPEHECTALDLARQVRPFAEKSATLCGWPMRLISIATDVLMLALLFPLFWIAILLGGMAFAGPATNGVLSGSDTAVYGVPVLGCFVAYYLGSITLFGWTPARRMMGLRLFNRDGMEAGVVQRFGCAALRIAAWLAICYGLFEALRTGAGLPQLGAFAAALFLGVGVYYCLNVISPYRIGFTDLLAGATWGRSETFDVGSNAASPFQAASTPTEDDADEAAPQRRLGHYTIRRELGRGGMGAVYLAWDELLHRNVALKVISPGVARRADLIARFEREAVLASSLTHKHLARIYGVGRDDDTPFLVMEYIEGVTLQEFIKKEGPLPENRVWLYLHQAASGLAEAHRWGIIHRDLKPSNIMIKPDGSIVVMDFGLAKSGDQEETADAGAEPAASGVDTASVDDGAREVGAANGQRSSSSVGSSSSEGELTVAGAVLGTPMFMSPEQAGGQVADGRSDIYSLGLSAWYMLTGRNPFTGKATEVLAKQRDEDVEIPDDIHLNGKRRGVLARMLAKQPTDRYQACEQLLQDLEQTKAWSAVRADLGQRALAYLLDATIWTGAAGVIHGFGVLILGGGEVAIAIIQLMSLAAILGMMVVPTGWYGFTPGKWLLKLRVVTANGEPIGLGRSLLRLSIYWPSLFSFILMSILQLVGFGDGVGVVVLVLPVIGWLSCGFSAAMLLLLPEQRAIHDYAVGSYVVRSPD